MQNDLSVCRGEVAYILPTQIGRSPRALVCPIFHQHICIWKTKFQVEVNIRMMSF